MGEPIDPNNLPSGYPPTAYPPTTYLPPGYSPFQPAALPPQLRETPPRDRRRLLVVIGAVIVVGVGAVVAVTLASSGSGTSTVSAPLPMPSSISQYHRDLSAAVDQYRSGLVSDHEKGELGRFFTRAQLGIYTTGEPGVPGVSPTLILLTGRTGDYPNIAEAALTGAVMKSVANPILVVPGADGGSLECALDDEDGAEATICVWSDSTSVGLVFSTGTSLSPEKVGDLTNIARATIDH
jgi:hypothetical protein